MYLLLTDFGLSDCVYLKRKDAVPFISIQSVGSGKPEIKIRENSPRPYLGSKQALTYYS